MRETDETLVLIQTPCEVLRPFVRRFLVVESNVARSDSHLPDTGFFAAFSFRGDCKLDGGAQAPHAAITGLWDTIRMHEHSRDHAVLVAAFTAQGAAALLREPLEEFANTTIDLGDVLSRRTSLNDLPERLAEAPNHAERIRLVEELLLARVREAQPDPLVAAAVALIEHTQATMRIEEVVRRIGLSQSALERRFRRIVGASPRRFASLVRLRNVVRLCESGADLGTVAHAAGYADQSHFIKDFRRFAGVAPGSFFSSVG